MIEEKGILDSSDSDPTSSGRIEPIEIYKLQRTHFSKMVETLYRMLPLYIAIVGAMWGYGFSLRATPNNNGVDFLASLVMLATFLVSLAFSHIINRYGGNMYKTLESVRRFEAPLAPGVIIYPTTEPEWSEDKKTHYFKIAFFNRFNALRNIKAHEAIQYCFCASAVLALVAAIYFNIRTILAAVGVSLIALAGIVVLALIVDKIKKLNAS